MQMNCQQKTQNPILDWKHFDEAHVEADFGGKEWSKLENNAKWKKTHTIFTGPWRAQTPTR